MLMVVDALAPVSEYKEIHRVKSVSGMWCSIEKILIIPAPYRSIYMAPSQTTMPEGGHTPFLEITHM